MATLGELVVSLSANTAQFTSAMDKAAYLSQKRMDSIVKAASAAGQMMGTAMVAGAGAFAVAITRAINAADELGKSAQKLGMTTEALSGLQYAAELSGLSNEDLSTSINKLNKSIAEGNPAFEAMGISLKDVNGNLKSSDQVLQEVAGKFVTYKDGVEKSALAMEVFGKSGARMVPLLNSGADGLNAMAEEARSLGLVISSDMAKSAEAFNDNLTRVQKTQSGLVTQLTAQLLPVMEQASQEFVDLARNTDLVTGPAEALKVLFQTLAVVGSDVAFVFKMTGQEIGGIAAQLAQFAQGNFAAGFSIGDMMKEDAARARAELDAFQARIMGIGQVIEAVAKKNEQSGGGGIAAPIVKAAKAAKGAVENELTWVAKEYAKVMEKISGAETDAEKSTRDLNAAQSALFELMTSPAWENMPETWQQMVIAQTASATAASEAAEKYKRLHDMLDATPTAQLEKSRADMLLLKESFEAGEISAEQFVEAAGTRLGTLPQVAEEAASSIDMVISNAFDGMANSLADFVMGGKASFSDLVKSMIRDLIKLQVQTSMTTLFKDAGGLSGIVSAIGNLFTGGAAGSSSPTESWIDAGGLAGARAGGGSVSAGASYLVGENGPEILTMGASSGYVTPNGGLSPNITINVSNQAAGDGYQAQTSARNNNGRIDIDVMVVKAIQKDMKTNGPITQGFGQMFGMSRSAA